MSEKQQLFIDSETKIEAFLTYLATDRNVAAATQNQAMNALVFLYKQVLEKRLDVAGRSNGRKLVGKSAEFD